MVKAVQVTHTGGLLACFYVVCMDLWLQIRRDSDSCKWGVSWLGRCPCLGFHCPVSLLLCNDPQQVNRVHVFPHQQHLTSASHIVSLLTAAECKHANMLFNFQWAHTQIVEQWLVFPFFSPFVTFPLPIWGFKPAPFDFVYSFSKRRRGGVGMWCPVAGRLCV